jgi:hypothetical protein
MLSYANSFTEAELAELCVTICMICAVVCVTLIDTEISVRA